MMADAARKKIIQVPGIGEVLLVKRRGATRLRISVSPRRGVVVSMPWLLPYAIAEKFLLSKRQWVAAALERQAGQMHRAAESGTSTCALSSSRSICRTTSYCTSSATCAIRITARSFTPCWTPCSPAGKKNCNVSFTNGVSAKPGLFSSLDFHASMESETESETITDAGGKSAIQRTVLDTAIKFPSDSETYQTQVRSENRFGHISRILNTL